jgi:hypothetical protein
MDANNRNSQMKICASFCGDARFFAVLHLFFTGATPKHIEDSFS